MAVKILVNQDKIAEFCRRHSIRKLSLFGSVLRDDFNENSDVDVLVEFDSGAKVGLFKLAGLEIELGEMLDRKVDLNTPLCLSQYYRKEVLAKAKVQYERA